MKKILMILILLSIPFALSDNSSPEKILIINSYNEDYTWTNDLMNGILDHMNNDVDVRVEYMDAKNFYDEDDFGAFHDLMMHKYNDTTFDAIVTTDDVAFSYVMTERTFYKEAPVFFIGINSKDKYPFEQYQNVFGIIEAVSIKDTIDVAKKLKPSLRTIHVIIDSTPTGQATKSVVMNVLDPHFEIVFYDGKTLDEIEFNLKQIDNEDTIVLLAYYIVDPRGYAFDTHIMSQKITEASPVPVFGLYDFSLEHGIVGGKLISGYDQGKRINELITKYFDGELDNKYIESKEANVHKYDYSVLEKYDFKVRKLPEDAVVLNRPVSFLVKHRNVIISSVIIILILVIYIFILRVQVKHQTKKTLLYNEKLNEADKLASLGEMMNRISHELNTPLGNSITTASYISKLNSQLIEQFNEGKLSKSLLLEKINNIEYSSELLIASLNEASELMEAFRIFSEHNEQEEITIIDLNYYVKNLIRTYTPLLNNHKHQIKFVSKENIIVRGRTKDYYKIFNHLIRNSIEHGFKDMESKEIKIDMGMDKKSLHILYQDNGSGIHEKDLSNIFKPLYSTDGKKHHGLGLSQVKDTITSLGGNIECQSKPYKGVNINITMPIDYKKI